MAQVESPVKLGTMGTDELCESLIEAWQSEVLPHFDGDDRDKQRFEALVIATTSRLKGKIESEQSRSGTNGVPSGYGRTT